MDTVTRGWLIYQLTDSVVQLGLAHTVITSVTRDDLPDGGSAIFAENVANPDLMASIAQYAIIVFAVIAAVEKVAPAVVTIRSSGGGLLGSEEGTGSGVIYDADGWIHQQVDCQALFGRASVQAEDVAVSLHEPDLLVCAHAAQGWNVTIASTWPDLSSGISAAGAAWANV